MILSQIEGIDRAFVTKKAPKGREGSHRFELKAPISIGYLRLLILTIRREKVACFHGAVHAPGGHEKAKTLQTQLDELEELWRRCYKGESITIQ